MQKNAAEMLTFLLSRSDLSKELLAHKFQVHTITIDRWATGETKPSHIEKKYLNKLYNDYKKK